ncbi:TonB-dependent receptor domain-containing protein [Pontixanthobacter aquaemixtae]|uniref:TonB-dependent receptor n=1 Tax=Pontixanthobacter aquaemixtae TaxID=1958940 RepID=A0A844ZND0_9SPHN|nr:TonB-dependent receptor [Pontixanthobacter aquaemixtae]MXO89881.1 TonB-dependent receptor [Pontixanthobacter aquaemixtae]
MMKLQLRRSCAFMALAAGITTTPAFAQEAEQAEQPNEEIVITGSLIRGTPEDSSLPVDVISTEELAAEGQTNPLDFIKDIPSVGAVLGDSNQFSSAAQGLGGVGTINLRNLGATRTLVLLNGRRTLVSPGDGVSDTNLLPLFALQRVELLKDGAAVTYGSDAVAGVANFITRTNFEGIELQGDHTFVRDSDGDYTASILAGYNITPDVNIMAGFGYRHRSKLAAVDREISNQDYFTNPSGFSTTVTNAWYPALRVSGPVRETPAPASLGAASYRGTLLAGVPGGVDPDCDDVGGLPISIFCGYQFTDYNNLVEDQDYYQGFLQVTADLSDKLRFNADGLYAYSRIDTALSPSYPTTQGLAGPGATFQYYIPFTNPAFADFAARVGFPTSIDTDGDPTTAPLPVTGAQALVFRPFSLGGYPLAEGSPFGQDESFSINESFRISAGFEYDLTPDLVMSLQGTYVNAKSRSKVPDVLPLRIQQALDGLGGPDCDVATGTPGQGSCYYFNPFFNSVQRNPAQGIDNPNYNAALANRDDVVDYLYGDTGTLQNEKQFIADFLISGEVADADFGGGALAFGVGAQYRSSNFESMPRNALNSLALNPCAVPGDTSCTIQQGPFSFLGQARDIAVEQDVYALFGEVLVPFSPRFEMSFALRFEDYGDPIGSTLDPKASFRWEPNDWLVLRGSVGTTFRAPLPGQVSQSRVTALQPIDAAGGGFLSVDVLGNPNLTPESAFTYNLGAVVQSGGFRASLDYWSYEFEDQIVVEDSNAIANVVVPTPNGLADCSSPLASQIVFQGGCVQGTTVGGDISRVITNFVNGPPITTTGIDFDASYDFDIGSNATLRLGTNGTWVLSYDVESFAAQNVEIQPAFGAVGFGNFDRTAPAISDLRANLYANFNVGGLNARYTFRYASGVYDDRYDSPTFATVPRTAQQSFYARESGDFTQSDLTILYDLPFDGLDVQLQGSVSNIFDEDPPIARLELGYNPFLGNAIGRTFRLGAKVRF